MKKILFLLAVSVFSFSETMLVMGMHNQTQSKQKFDKNEIMKRILGLGISPKSTAYFDLLDQGSMSAVSRRVRDLQQQFNKLAGCMRDEQIDYDDKISEQLQKIVTDEMDKCAILIERGNFDEIFDKLLSFLPEEKYRVMEAAILKLISCRNDVEILNIVKKTLEEIKPGMPVDKVVNTLHYDVNIDDPKTLSGYPRNVKSALETIIRRSELSAEEKKLCSNTLKGYENILWKPIEVENDFSHDMGEILSHLDHDLKIFTERPEYSDIKNLFDELIERIVTALARSYRHCEDLQNFDSCYYAPATNKTGVLCCMSILGQDLACLLDKIAHSSEFGPDFTESGFVSSYEYYCNWHDAWDLDLEASRPLRMQRLPANSRVKIITNAYEIVESAVRRVFSKLSVEERLLIFRNIRVFLMSLRSIVQNNSDAAVKNREIKRALAVLECFGQTVPSLEADVKDIPLELNETQLSNIEKFKQKRLLEIKAFSEKIKELGSIEEDITPFLKEYNELADRIKQKFLNDETGFNLMRRAVSEFLVKRAAEINECTQQLPNDLNEIRSDMLAMSSSDLFHLLSNLKMNISKISKERKFYKEIENAEKLRLNELSADEVEEALGEQVYDRDFRDYVVNLAKERISIINKAKSLMPLPFEVYTLPFIKHNAKLFDDLIDYKKCISGLQDCHQKLAQQWINSINKFLPYAEELDSLRIVEKLMSKTGNLQYVMFDFDTEDGHFDTKVIREGNKVEDIAYPEIPTLKYRPIPLPLYDFFVEVDADPKNVKKLTHMLDNLSDEMLDYADLHYANQSHWAEEARHLINIRRKHFGNKEKLHTLYAMAMVSDDMNAQQIAEFLSANINDPKKAMSELTVDDIFYESTFMKELCILDRLRIFMLFDGNFNSEFRRDLMLTDAELKTECEKYSLKRDINSTGLYEALSEGSRYKEEGNAYFLEVFIRALGIIFGYEDKHYPLKHYTDLLTNKKSADINKMDMAIPELAHDIASQGSIVKPFITDVIEGCASLNDKIYTSLLNIYRLKGENIDPDSIAGINYLFRKLEKRIEDYCDKKAKKNKISADESEVEIDANANGGAEQSTDTSANNLDTPEAGISAGVNTSKPDEDRVAVANLVGTIIQGISHCLAGQDMMMHHVNIQMMNEDENISKVHTADLLKHLIQMCSSSRFNSIFHFIDIPPGTVFKIVESHGIRGFDLTKDKLDPEEIMARSAMLEFFNGKYGLSKSRHLLNLTRYHLNQMHLYILGQVGKGDMTVLKVLKDLRNSQDETVREYGADYTSGDVGTNFYNWFFPIAIKNRVARQYVGNGAAALLPEHKKLLNALIDEPMQNIYDVIDYASGETCSFIHTIIETKVKAEETDGKVAFSTKLKKIDGSDTSGEKYMKYLNMRIIFHLMKKHGILIHV